MFYNSLGRFVFRVHCNQGPVNTQETGAWHPFLQNLFAETFAAHGWPDQKIDMTAPFFQMPVQAVAYIKRADIFAVFYHP